MQVTTRLATYDDRTIKLEIWDAPTSKHLAPLVKCRDYTAYYPSVKAFLVVFDLTSLSSLEFALKCLEGLPLKAPRVLVGAKAEAAHDIDRAFAREMAGRAEAGYIETSSRTGYNIESLFLDLAANC
jgi:GTPase SAR1 family protein